MFSLIAKWISLIIIGFGIGWLAGLSVSPVVSIIITSIIGVSITLASVLSGLKSGAVQPEGAANTQTSSDWNATPVPIALIILGLVIGSILGIVVRNWNLLGSDIRPEIQKWTDAGLKLPEEEIALRLFNREYLSKETPSETTEKSKTAGTILFSIKQADCDSLLGVLISSPEELPKRLGGTNNKFFRVLPEIVHDSETLQKVVRELCKEDIQSQ